jgi:RNA polymerase sigma-70 factor (ECF subfamily)
MRGSHGGDGGELTTVLAGARAGSVPAFERIYTELAPTIAGYLRFSGVDDVDGLTNEVLAQVHRGLGRFNGDWAGFRSWVFTIAHHRMIDDRRRSRRRPVQVAGEVALEAAAGDVEEEAFSVLADERLARLVGHLSDDQREVLLLRIVADLSLEATAEALDKTVGAVKSLQHRALAALRRKLEQEGPDE